MLIGSSLPTILVRDSPPFFNMKKSGNISFSFLIRKKLKKYIDITKENNTNIKFKTLFILDFLRNNNPNFFKIRLITGFSKTLKPRKIEVLQEVY